MADHGTAIEWTQAPGYKGETWNPVTGCDKVSPGCAHCYAETFAERWRGIPGHPYEQGFDLTLRPERLDQPLRWRRPRMVFVNSMSDLFHEEISNEYIAAVFGVMAKAERHIFQVLTKRPERMHDWFRWYAEEVRERELEHDPAEMGLREAQVYGVNEELLWPPFGESCWPLPNVWLGVSIENRRFVDRADLLRATPAAVRFISAEPLLGPLVFDGDDEVDVDGGLIEYWSDDYAGPELDLDGIDWLIVGGESGSGHRPIDSQWVRDLRDATMSCEPEVAFFFKQWGGRTPKAGGRLLDGRAWDEWPIQIQGIAA